MTSGAPTAFRHASFHGHIGIARADITPPVGIYARNWGAAEHDVAAGIHRPLTLTALALASMDGSQRQVLLDADLGWWKSPRTFKDFLGRLRESLGLSADRLIFALSHTHSAPPLMDADGDLPGSELHTEWMKGLYDTAVRTAHAALAETFEGAIEWHKGRCSLAANRDLPDVDSERPRFICGYNPNIPADDTLLVGRITDMAEAIRGTIVNYACHPTTLAWDNTSISPDYLGAMRSTLQDATGAPAIFFLGTCGELAPRYQYVGDPAVADRHGRELGHAALATLSAMEPPGKKLQFDCVVESGAPLAVWKHQPSELSQRLGVTLTSIALPLKDWPTAEELETEWRNCDDRALKERLRRKLNIRLGLGDGRTYELPIYAWRIGDAVLIGSCCEAYSLLQQELRRRFPQVTVLAMNLINGSIGYLPPAELYDADAYAAWQTPFERGGLEHVLDTMTKVIGDAIRD